jgi:hypothetical protein
MARRSDSGKSRREFLESTGFPALFRAAYERWRAALPANQQRGAQRVLADHLHLTDPKNIRNWMQGVSAPASNDAWAALRAILAETPANAEQLLDLDTAFAEARGLGQNATKPLPAPQHPLVWRTGKSLPAIFGLIEFRLRIGSNAGPDTATCPVHAVLIPGQCEWEVDGRPVLVAFRYLLLSFMSEGHVPREDSFLAMTGHSVPGMKRISGGWRLDPPDGGTLLLTDPTRGDCLFILDGKGKDASPTIVELLMESGGLDLRDPIKPNRSPKKAAVLDAIFRERRDRDGTGRFVVGRGEIWQEEET